MTTAGWLGLCTFLALHLGAAIWAASSLKTRVDVLVESMRRFELSLATMALQDSRIAVLDSRVSGLEHRLEETRSMVLGPRKGSG